MYERKNFLHTPNSLPLPCLLSKIRWQLSSLFCLHSLRCLTVSLLGLHIRNLLYFSYCKRKRVTTLLQPQMRATLHLFDLVTIFMKVWKKKKSKKIRSLHSLNTGGSVSQLSSSSRNSQNSWFPSWAKKLCLWICFKLIFLLLRNTRLFFTLAILELAWTQVTQTSKVSPIHHQDRKLQRSIALDCTWAGRKRRGFVLYCLHSVLTLL